jgi:hypothetical protein
MPMIETAQKIPSGGEMGGHGDISPCARQRNPIPYPVSSVRYFWQSLVASFWSVNGNFIKPMAL